MVKVKYLDGDVMPDYSNASGLIKGFKKSLKTGQANRTKQKSADSSNTQAAIKAMSKPITTVKLPPLPKEDTKKMSMGMKVGIGAGVLIVLGVIGFGIYKMTKK